jgi:SEC-C motif-containing protein
VTCECGKGPSTDECCGRFIKGDAKPETAEALMRSRYTAYAIQEIDYLEATHDPKTVKNMDREDTEKWAKEAKWEGLEIVETEAGGPEDETGVVEFIARYESDGNSIGHHERSTFRKIDGAWFYVDGDMVKPKPVKRETPKVGRNEPCPCGSGKKYKKCCGR